MSTLLMILEHKDGIISSSSKSALTAAQAMVTPFGISSLIGVMWGPGGSKAAEEAGTLGISESYAIDGPEVSVYTAGAVAAVVASLAKKKGVNLIVGAASSTGKDFLPRVATLLGAGQASDIIAVNNDRSFIRPMYAGDVFAQVLVTTPTTVVTVRSSAFSAAADIGTTGSVHILSASGLVSSHGGFSFPPSVTVVSQEVSGGGRPELADAKVIVSGGRALGSAENFEKVLFPLADVLNAALGASRAAVDAGYAPNDWQVGQTGKIVAPDLYIAVGISGAIQHLAGMKDAKIIVAINKDADAPIFELASYGLVGDLFSLVPELTEALKGN